MKEFFKGIFCAIGIVVTIWMLLTALLGQVPEKADPNGVSFYELPIGVEEQTTHTIHIGDHEVSFW